MANRKVRAAATAEPDSTPSLIRAATRAASDRPETPRSRGDRRDGGGQHVSNQDTEYRGDRAIGGNGGKESDPEGEVAGDGGCDHQTRAAGIAEHFRNGSAHAHKIAQDPAPRAGTQKTTPIKTIARTLISIITGVPGRLTGGR